MYLYLLWWWSVGSFWVGLYTFSNLIRHIGLEGINYPVFATSKTGSMSHLQLLSGVSVMKQTKAQQAVLSYLKRNHTTTYVKHIDRGIKYSLSMDVLRWVCRIDQLFIEHIHLLTTFLDEFSPKLVQRVYFIRQGLTGNIQCASCHREFLPSVSGLNHSARTGSMEEWYCSRFCMSVAPSTREKSHRPYFLGMA